MRYTLTRADFWGCIILITFFSACVGFRLGHNKSSHTTDKSLKNWNEYDSISEAQKHCRGNEALVFRGSGRFSCAVPSTEQSR